MGRTRVSRTEELHCQQDESSAKFLNPQTYSSSELLGQYAHGLNILLSLVGQVGKGLVSGAGQDQSNKQCLSLHSHLDPSGLLCKRPSGARLSVQSKSAARPQHEKKIGIKPNSLVPFGIT